MNKKHLYLLGLMALVMGMFILNSCSSDDDESTADASSIYGTWQWVSSEGTEDGKDFSKSYGEGRLRYYRINADNTWEYYNQDRDDGKWRGSKGNLIFDFENKKITLKYGEKEIVEFTKNTLKLQESSTSSGHSWTQTDKLRKVDDSVLDKIIADNSIK